MILNNYQCTTTKTTYHFWKRQVQQDSRNSECLVVISGSHCHWAQAFLNGEAEKSSEIQIEINV